MRVSKKLYFKDPISFLNLWRSRFETFNLKGHQRSQRSLLSLKIRFFLNRAQTTRVNKKVYFEDPISFLFYEVRGLRPTTSKVTKGHKGHFSLWKLGFYECLLYLQMNLFFDKLLWKFVQLMSISMHTFDIKWPLISKVIKGHRRSLVNKSFVYFPICLKICTIVDNINAHIFA